MEMSVLTKPNLMTRWRRARPRTHIHRPSAAANPAGKRERTRRENQKKTGNSHSTYERALRRKRQTSQPRQPSDRMAGIPFKRARHDRREDSAPSMGVCVCVFVVVASDLSRSHWLGPTRRRRGLKKAREGGPRTAAGPNAPLATERSCLGPGRRMAISIDSLASIDTRARVHTKGCERGRSNKGRLGRKKNGQGGPTRRQSIGIEIDSNSAVSILG